MFQKILIAIVTIIILIMFTIGTLYLVDKINTLDVKFYDYKLADEIYFDANSTHGTNKIRVSATGNNVEKDEDGLISIDQIEQYSEIYRIIVDNRAYDFTTAIGEGVYETYKVGDINNDGCYEILVGIYKIFEPSEEPYWMIYSCTKNDELVFITAIPNGTIQYNNVKNKVVVTCTISNTIIPVEEIMEFDFEGGK